MSLAEADTGGIVAGPEAALGGAAEVVGACLPLQAVKKALTRIKRAKTCFMGFIVMEARPELL